MSTVRRSAGFALAIDALALVLIVASVPLASHWLDGARPAGLAQASPAGSAIASPGSSPLPSGATAEPGESGRGSGGPAESGGPTASPSPSPIYGDGTWTATQSMPQAIWGTGSAVLRDGRVLVVGGATSGNSNAAVSKVELYDPKTGKWTSETKMLQARAYPMTALLPDGSVLVAGGSRNALPLDTAERYLPDSGTWVGAGRMHVPRTHGTATVLADGRVLLAGGGSKGSPSFAATATAELYNSTTDTWTPAASMSVARTFHTASLLPGGAVLVTGGASAFYGEFGTVTSSAEIYDPAANVWHPANPMSIARYLDAAVVLHDGRVLVAGGWALTSNTDPSRASSEVYNPTTNSWTSAGSMSDGRARFRMTVLPDGRVLAAGGVGPNYKVVRSADLWDPTTGQWQATGQLGTAVMWPVLATLPDGRVLIAGGALDSLAKHPSAVCALYAPPPL